jgi:hypothetical protein
VVACAACLSSAFGDRTYNWPYYTLFAAPFLVAAVIGGVLAYWAGVRPGAALRALRRSVTLHIATHRKETT